MSGNDAGYDEGIGSLSGLKNPIAFPVKPATSEFYSMLGSALFWICWSVHVAHDEVD
jgi:hypothetical protein